MAAARRRANRMNRSADSQASKEAETDGGSRTPPQRVDRPDPTTTARSVEKEPEVTIANARKEDSSSDDEQRRTPPQRVTRDSRPEQDTNARGGSSTASRGRERAAVETHKVQPGDTFASLAKMYYGDEKYTGFLASSNREIDPRTLGVGTEVKIPPLPRDGGVGDAGSRVAARERMPVRRASDSTATERGTRTYTVRSGDTFYGIARDQLNDASRWRELFELNKALVHGDATRLQVGQVITLPSP